MSGYSPVISARVLPSQATGDLIAGHWRLLIGWGTVPRTLVWHNDSGAGEGRVMVGLAGFAALLAAGSSSAARASEANGLVERADDCPKTGFS
ncbi:hypothetical protein AB0B07_23220 [Streptomyces sioyaensis]|uniref:hypothetical protein n=1 Tax=Streptomyces sioyaensis TaxID=67364 RepID=UPI00340B44CB